MPIGDPVEGGGGSGGGGSSGFNTGGSGGAGLDARQVKSLLIRHFPQLLARFGGMTRPNNVMHAPLVLTAGGIVNRTEVDDASYTMIEPDCLVVFTSLTGSRSVQLIDRPEGQLVILKDESGNAGAFPITVLPPSGQTIDGESRAEIGSAFGSAVFYTDGANWFSLDRELFDSRELVSETEMLWLFVAALYGFILGEFGATVSVDYAELGFEMIGAN